MADVSSLSGKARSGDLCPPERERRHVSLGCYLVAAYGVATAFLMAHVNGWQGGAYWAVPVATAVQAAGAAASPRLRFRRDEWLTPGNFALVMWFIELVILPALLVVADPRLGPLRTLPSATAINAAICLQALAFASFAACYVRRAGRPGRPGARGPERTSPRPVPIPVVLSFLAIGMLGMVLLFRTPSEAWAYYTGRLQLVEPGTQTSVRDGLSALIRPYLGVAALLWLQRGLTATSSSMRLPWWRIWVAIGLIFIAYSTYHYNRQAFAIALISFMAALSIKVRRIGLPGLVVISVSAIVFAFYFGAYRTVYIGTRAGQLSTWQVGLENYHPDPLEQLGTYIGAPQFIAIPIQASADGKSPLGPMSFVASALSPIPIIGKPYREESTVKKYNEYIYGSSIANDQHPPLTVDLFWTFGIIGVIIGSALLGWVMGAIDFHHRTSAQLVGIYTNTFLAITVIFVIAEGIANLTQTLLYFCVPLYAFRRYMT